MKYKDQELIEEIHQWRVDLLAQCGNDVEKLGEYLRQKEAEHPERIVTHIKYVTKKNQSSNTNHPEIM